MNTKTLLLAVFGFSASVSVGAQAGTPAQVAPVAAPADSNAGGRTGGLATNPIDGSLYGTAEFGGAYGFGEVYQLTPPAQAGGTWTRTTVYSFTGGSDGEYPIGGLVKDANGVLYGVTSGNELGVGGINLTATAGGQSGSTVFSLVVQGGSYTLTTIAQLGEYSASGGLAIDANGVLYGTSQRAANASSGEVFRVAPTPGAPASSINAAGWITSVLYEFLDPTKGTFPQGGVALGSDGSVYGSTEVGGDAACHDGRGCGTVFRLMPGASAPWAIKIMQVFHGGATGDHPAGPVLVDSSGNVMGVTTFGGTSSTICTEGCGVVYQVAAKGGLRVVHAFCSTRQTIATACSDGLAPSGGLMRSSDGHFYGAAALGGSSDRGGTIFKVDPFGSFAVMAAMPASFGGEPSSRLTQVQSSLLGTTGGNRVAQGVIFALSP